MESPSSSVSSVQLAVQKVTLPMPGFGRGYLSRNSRANSGVSGALRNIVCPHFATHLCPDHKESPVQQCRVSPEATGTDSWKHRAGRANGQNGQMDVNTAEIQWEFPTQ
jgi:hypothetical protein